MIRKLIVRRFKRFAEQEFNLDGHVVLAGPNNMGKTTVLQALAAWNLALTRWKQLNNFQRRGGSYEFAPIARQAFLPVPLRNFDWLWNQRSYHGSIEIEVQSNDGWSVTMEFRPNSTEQIYVHPKADAEPDIVRRAEIRATYVPPMTGLSIDEPVYTRAKQDQLLGQGRPGEIIRNLLIEASQSAAWEPLTEAVRRLFRCNLLAPDGAGADIICEFQPLGGGPRLDISSAGSGMQQVLMLLAFLHMRPASLLLLDEPDAHLHVFLQDSIYDELRSVAARRNSQLIIATHSEVIINSVAPEELCLVYNTPRRLADVTERSRLVESLRVLTQADVMLALNSKGVLYLEGHTDLANLREWARILNHPMHAWLSSEPFWKPSVWEPRPGATGIKAKEHFDALKLVNNNVTGVLLIDADGKQRGITPSATTQAGALNRMTWARYETESYLVHPNALARFIDQKAGNGGADAVRRFMTNQFNGYLGETVGAQVANDFIANPIQPQQAVTRYLAETKARTVIIGGVLQEGGVHGMDYTRFSEIAAIMLPEEIHPEVKEKLDFIQQAFGL